MFTIPLIVCCMTGAWAEADPDGSVCFVALHRHPFHNMQRYFGELKCGAQVVVWHLMTKRAREISCDWLEKITQLSVRVVMVDLLVSVLYLKTYICLPLLLLAFLKCVVWAWGRNSGHWCRVCTLSSLDFWTSTVLRMLKQLFIKANPSGKQHTHWCWSSAGKTGRAGELLIVVSSSCFLFIFF